MEDINLCEVCDSSNLYSVLNLGDHPLCDDLISIGEKRICEKHPIEVLLCRDCFTAHQKFSVKKNLLFHKDYHYRARFTSDVLEGMKDLVNRVGVFFKKEFQDLTVLDIGCNDGSLLNYFAEKGVKRTIGVEPTGAGLEAKESGHHIINKFFTESIASQIISEYKSVDVITFTNVFAHIEDLNSLLSGIKTLMNENTLLVIENHYLGSVLKKNQFDTFYHEHPRTYSLTSFIKIAQKINKKLISCEFPKRYGGNIRVIFGPDDQTKQEILNYHNDVLDAESLFEDEFALMRKFISSWRIEKKEEIESLVSKHGPLTAKAFPARAAILIELIGLSEKHIKCVSEKPGSMKIGNYVPGTRIPIISDDEAFKDPTEFSVLLNLAWHINTEIESYLRDRGFNGKIINILD